MENKWTKWYAMTSHVFVYRSKELHFGKHAFNFHCFLDDLNCVFTQIRCLSVLLLCIFHGKNRRGVKGDSNPNDKYVLSERAL